MSRTFSSRSAPVSSRLAVETSQLMPALISHCNSCDGYKTILNLIGTLSNERTNETPTLIGCSAPSATLTENNVGSPACKGIVVNGFQRFATAHF